MLPISEAMLAKDVRNNSDANIDWILFDVYKIAADFPLQVSVYGYIFDGYNENDVVAEDSKHERIKVTDKFRSKSTRDDLMGLKLKCGLVVCTKFQFILFFFHIQRIQVNFNLTRLLILNDILILKIQMLSMLIFLPKEPPQWPLICEKT